MNKICDEHEGEIHQIQDVSDALEENAIRSIAKLGKLSGGSRLKKEANILSKSSDEPFPKKKSNILSKSSNESLIKKRSKIISESSDKSKPKKKMNKLGQSSDKSLANKEAEIQSKLSVKVIPDKTLSKEKLSVNVILDKPLSKEKLSVKVIPDKPLSKEKSSQRELTKKKPKILSKSSDKPPRVKKVKSTPKKRALENSHEPEQSKALKLESSCNGIMSEYDLKNVVLQLGLKCWHKYYCTNDITAFEIKAIIGSDGKDTDSFSLFSRECAPSKHLYRKHKTKVKLLSYEGRRCEGCENARPNSNNYSELKKKIVLKQKRINTVLNVLKGDVTVKGAGKDLIGFKCCNNRSLSYHGSALKDALKNHLASAVKSTKKSN